MLNKDFINNKEYDFLRTDPHLKDNICLLTLGGSHAYGTNTQASDIDLRGVALESKEEILTGTNFEQVIDTKTDTTIYGFRKFVSLLTKCNPNTIELLGNEDYIFLNDVGRKLLENKDLFITKQAFYTFGGYARAQLNRLENKSFPDLPQPKKEEQILRSIENAKNAFPEKYPFRSGDKIDLYIDDSAKQDLETEIFLDISLSHYPLRDSNAMLAELQTVLKDYDKLGHRNKNAETNNKINKHAMHLVRLMLTGTELLKTGEIHTYRKDDHEFLMDIRNGKFMQNGVLNKEFFQMIDELNNNLKEAYEKSPLPDKVDKNKVNKFILDIYEKNLFNKQDNKFSKLESIKEQIEEISENSKPKPKDYNL